MAELTVAKRGRETFCNLCGQQIPEGEKHVFLGRGRFRHRNCYLETKTRRPLL